MRKIIISVILTVLITAGIIYAVEVVRIAPLTYSIANNTTTVTTSATAIPTTNLVGRESIAIRLNSTSDTAYIGTSSVTTSNGWTLDSSCPAITLDIDDSVQLYGICSSGTVDIRSLEAK